MFIIVSVNFLAWEFNLPLGYQLNLVWSLALFEWLLKCGILLLGAVFMLLYLLRIFYIGLIMHWESH